MFPASSASAKPILLDLRSIHTTFNIPADEDIPDAGTFSNGTPFAAANSKREYFFVFPNKAAYIIHFM